MYILGKERVVIGIVNIWLILGQNINHMFRRRSYSLSLYNSIKYLKKRKVYLSEKRIFLSYLN